MTEEPTEPDRDCYDCDQVGCLGCNHSTHTAPHRPADRAAVLLEAAEHFERRATIIAVKDRVKAASVWTEAAVELRLMAAKVAEMDRLREEMTIKLCSGDPTDQADAYTALQEITGSDPRNDRQATKPLYDPIAWKAYSRDAGCGCTAPDPADCSLSHGAGAWLCVCHRLSALPTRPTKAACFHKHVRGAVLVEAIDVARQESERLAAEMGGAAETGQPGPNFVRVCTACPRCDHTVDANGDCGNDCTHKPANRSGCDEALPDVCDTCDVERCETCHACRCNRGDDNTCGAPDCPGTRVRHSGPDTKFCVLCLSGEHERVAVETGTKADAAGEGDNPRAVCVCGHTRGQHARVDGRLLCNVCDPNSTENLACEEFEAL